MKHANEMQDRKTATKIYYLNIKDENKNMEMSDNTQNGPVSKNDQHVLLLNIYNNYGL